MCERLMLCKISSPEMIVGPSTVPSQVYALMDEWKSRFPVVNNS